MAAREVFDREQLSGDALADGHVVLQLGVVAEGAGDSLRGELGELGVGVAGGVPALDVGRLAGWSATRAQLTLPRLALRRLAQVSATTRGLVFEKRPFWPLMLEIARFRFGLWQRWRLLTIRPFLPPCMSRMKRDTGRSGMPAKVERMPPRTESMRCRRAHSWWRSG